LPLLKFQPSYVTLKVFNNWVPQGRCQWTQPERYLWGAVFNRRGQSGHERSWPQYLTFVSPECWQDTSLMLVYHTGDLQFSPLYEGR